MALDAQARRRYARHVLLPEVGEAGQARLSAASVALTGDPRAVAVASLYLGRAGLRVGEGEGTSVTLGRLAGRPELAEAAAFVAGAFAAVEEIKRAVGAGRAGRVEDLPSLGGGRE